MRIAIIGPAHPYKGGIAQHTTELAHRLTEAGHKVEIISWYKQWPFFYPGQQFVDQPEMPLHPGTQRALSWKNPAGWGKWGRKLRGYDHLIFIWWVPTFQGPPYLGILKAMGKKRPPTTIICHNVLPHSSKPGDKTLTKAVLKRCDQVIVHSQAQADIAAGLSKTPVTIIKLPLSLLPDIEKPAKQPGKNLLFFGFVRPYKGVDILLKALAKVPDVKLTIAGEIWGDPKIYTNLIEGLGLEDRVTLLNGYMTDREMANLIVRADAAVLPYKSGTASVNVVRTNAYGKPAIATRVGSLAAQIHDDLDGLLCEPDNVESLAKAIKHFYEPGVAQRLTKNVPKVSAEEDWQDYVQAVTAKITV